MQAFFDLAFFQSLVTNVLGVLIGAAVGIPAGLWINRRTHSAAEKASLTASQREQLQDLQQTLRAIRGAASDNRELLRQCNKDLSPGSGIDNIYYNVDPRSLDVLTPALIARTNDFDLVNAVNNFRYQLDHFGKKVHSHYELEFGAAAGIGGPRISRRNELLASIREHGPKLLDEADALLGKLDRALATVADNERSLLPPTV